MVGKRRINTAVIFLLLWSGCSLGAKRAAVDPLQYNKSVKEVSAKQMLLNLVRIRYGEVPFFLTTSNITTSYEFETGVEGGGNVIGSAPDVFTWALLGRVLERPTVTYFPLQGEKFLSRVLQTIQLETLSSLFQSEWPINMLMRSMVHSIGRLENNPFQRTDSYRKFLQLVDIWHRAQMRGDFCLLKQQKPKPIFSKTMQEKDLTFMDIFRADKDGYILKQTSTGHYSLEKPSRPYFVVQTKCTQEEAALIASLLDIDPPQLESNEEQTVLLEIMLIESKDLQPMLQAGPLPRVAINMRNFLNVIYYLSLGVQVPEKDLKKKRAALLPPSQAGTNTTNSLPVNDLITVNSSYRCMPGTTYLNIRFQGKCFSIHGSDIKSKRMFGLLQILFMLQSGSRPDVQPLLTIPVGG